MTDQNTALIILRRAKTLANNARRYPHTREACHRYILLAIKWAAQRNFSSMVTKLSRLSLELGEYSPIQDGVTLACSCGGASGRW